VENLNADHRLPVRGECRAETARSGLAAGVGSQVGRIVAGIAGMDKHTAAGVEAGPGEEVVVAGLLLLVVAAVVALSGRPEATEPMRPNLLAVVQERVRERGPRAEHMALEPHMPLQRGAVLMAHRLLPVAVSSSIAGAILPRCCSCMS
jgi:hypothetical protein